MVERRRSLEDVADVVQIGGTRTRYTWQSSIMDVVDVVQVASREEDMLSDTLGGCSFWRSSRSMQDLLPQTLRA